MLDFAVQVGGAVTIVPSLLWGDRIDYSHVASIKDARISGSGAPRERLGAAGREVVPLEFRISIECEPLWPDERGQRAALAAPARRCIHDPAGHRHLDVMGFLPGGVTHDKLVAVFCRCGGLMSYSADSTDSWRRSATFVDRILKGARPAEMPIEQPTKFEFVVNLKTAKALGVAIPKSLLMRADQIIE